MQSRVGSFDRESTDVDGTSVDLTADVLIIAMYERPMLVHANDSQPGIYFATPTEESIPLRQVAVPLELVLAASRDPAVPSRMALTLSTALVWDGNTWTFGFAGTDMLGRL